MRGPPQATSCESLSKTPSLIHTFGLWSSTNIPVTPDSKSEGTQIFGEVKRKHSVQLYTINVPGHASYHMICFLAASLSLSLKYLSFAFLFPNPIPHSFLTYSLKTFQFLFSSGTATSLSVFFNLVLLLLAKTPSFRLRVHELQNKNVTKKLKGNTGYCSSYRTYVSDTRQESPN